MVEPRFPVVLFDMDGTLVDEKSAWEWVHDHFGVDNSDNLEAFFQGYLDDEAFMASDIALWQDAAGGKVHIKEVEEILAAAPLMPGTHELFDALNEAGVTTGIVSGGIDILAHRVAQELGIQVVEANGLAVDAKGFLTGQGICRVYLEDKATPTQRALRALGADGEQAAAVGNSHYDVGMFETVARGIAFAPVDQGVREGADIVLETKDMRALIDHLVEGWA
ncbi:MAG: HAD-IB family phosphatase [Candidatus Thermoplasmatota archaeon]|nr:HAD-IB family phosphatase [Candidatus Thermoplasmatota archaeon]